MSEKLRKVVCAALRKKVDGDDWYRMLVAPRHFDSIMHNQAYEFEKTVGLGWWANGEQGFLDQHGVFMNRKEAFQVATQAGQIIEKTGPAGSDELYSEDIY